MSDDDIRIQIEPRYVKPPISERADTSSRSDTSSRDIPKAEPQPKPIPQPILKAEETSSIMDYIYEHKITIAIVIVILALVFVLVYMHFSEEKPVIPTKDKLPDPDEVKKALAQSMMAGGGNPQDREPARASDPDNQSAQASQLAPSLSNLTQQHQQERIDMNDFMCDDNEYDEPYIQPTPVIVTNNNRGVDAQDQPTDTQQSQIVSCKHRLQNGNLCKLKPGQTGYCNKHTRKV